MGVMAVFALLTLVLVVALAKQNEATKDQLKRVEKERSSLQTQQKELRSQKDALERSRQDFAKELLELVDGSLGIVAQQNEAERWLRRLFEETGCDLELTEQDELRLGNGSSELYRSGDVRLSPEGLAALKQCRDRFLELAYCLSPDSAECLKDPDNRTADGGELPSITELREGVQALVLQGNTDAQRLTGRQTYIGASLEPIVENFVINADLGTERARQALGQLLALVQDRNDGEEDALQVMLSRVRIESPAFGRYQAGPAAWRVGECPDEGGCAEARNLALKVRWKKGELRRPMDAVRLKMCSLIADPGSAFRQGLAAANEDLDAIRKRFDCPDAAGSGAL